MAQLSEEILLKKVGLIINPVAGLGGSVGLKGTDGVAEEALRLGAEPRSEKRAAEALQKLLPLRHHLTVLCASGEMGEHIANTLGFQTEIVHTVKGSPSAADTIAAAKAMTDSDLLLFAGGDGTARDLVTSGITIPVIGIPTGVKIHSPVYAIRPERAGEIACRVLRGEFSRTQESEVVDINEEAYRNGQVSTSLYGYLNTPVARDCFQHGKASSAESERSQQYSIARDMIERMQPDVYYLVGPGSTTKAVMDLLELPDTLIGVDLICNKQLVAADLNEAAILRCLDEHETKLIVTPTGGQGYLFGRGNQQLSSEVLRRLTMKNIQVLATQEKLFHLTGRPLLIDTGDIEIDEMLSGYIRVIVHFHEEQVCKISSEL